MPETTQPPRRPHRLPAYALYGEPDAGAPEPLHVESIAARSGLHDWEIRPHRHDVLCQILVVRGGRAEALIDGATVALDGPALVVVPALAAHGFRFAPGIDGDVFTVAEAHLGALLAPHAGLAGALLRVHAHALRPGADVPALLAAAAALRAEAAGHAAWRGAGLDAALLRLAVAAARVLPAPDASAGVPLRGSGCAAPAGARALAHVQRLRALVEAQFRRQPGQAALAAQLGITATQLNRACRQVLGHGAQRVLHARLVLQAQRELAYTELPIKQIAFELGFSDAAYFTRFFRRHAQLAPAAWRQARRRRAPPQVAAAAAR